MIFKIQGEKFLADMPTNLPDAKKELITLNL